MRIKHNSIIWYPLVISIAIVLGIVIGNYISTKKFTLDKDRKINAVLNLIQSEYVDSIDVKDLVEQAIPAIIGNLDPHSYYIPASDIRAENEKLDGSMSGIGVSFFMMNDTANVDQVIPNGPAEKVGMLAGDRIISVNGESIVGGTLTAEGIRSKIRGEKGTKVRIGVKRNTSKKTLTFTIDPSDAKDFDDALSFKKLDNGNYEVGIHIADVSYYVQPGSVVDEEARARGTSVYLADRTVPMLPEKLCNKLCSLRPHERKLTFSAVFEITPLARVVTRWFGRTIIDSDYRFAYEGAQEIIEAGKVIKGYETSVDGTTTVVPEEVQEAVLILNKLALKFRKKRFASGAISFERPEMKVDVDELGRPIGVHQKISKEANWLIEEFMLLANRCVAEFVATGANLDKDGYAVTGKAPAKGWKEEKTFVYRVHDEPDMAKIDNLRGFVGNFGYTLGKVADGKEFSRELNGLFNSAKDKPEFNAIELLSLRTMAKARYDVNNIGHYGLAFTYYTHFTSPIRRYPDMMVHRLLASYLAGGKSADRETYEAACKYASQREVVAAEAERASVKYKLVEFMQDKVGNEFDGHISGLTEWGMYVEIEPTKIEGMVALRDIRSDFFQFDDEHYTLVGRRTHKVYNLGDAVRIRVKKANQEQCLLDYELVEPDAPERAPREERGEGSRNEGGRRGGRRSEHSEYTGKQRHGDRSGSKSGKAKPSKKRSERPSAGKTAKPSRKPKN